MSPLPCRILLVEQASRRALWDEVATSAPGGLLTPQDAAEYAAWGITGDAVVYQVGAGWRDANAGIPVLARLAWCQCRVCYASDQPLLVVLERPEIDAADASGWRSVLEILLRAVPPINEAPSGAAGTPSADPAEAGLPPGLKPPYRTRPDYPPSARTLVLVEDDRMVRTLCLRILQPHFLVVEVGASLDALTLADRWPLPLSLLISDVHLPRMDGITLARLWLQRRPESRVLLLSGNPHIDEALPPTVEFLAKPFRSDELMRAVTALVAATDAPIHG
jgi:CheY-like chemotaxis protein